MTNILVLWYARRMSNLLENSLPIALELTGETDGLTPCSRAVWNYPQMVKLKSF
jgi:hypothetical protein